MMNSSEFCHDRTERRRRIREKAQEAGGSVPNGIDYVEVDEKQTIITVYFLNKAPRNVSAENVRITGGVRIRDIRVKGIQLCEVEDPERDDCMRVEVERPGDFSIYTLHLVNAPDGQPGLSPLEGFDPRYAQIDFSFKASCPSDLDCAPVNTCYEEPPSEPEIDYLAKDYSSFRQLILDRLALVMPDWTERHVPDIGIALVELFAYVGDYLSYYQDAVATEAYLDTARQRISVRRHAALVDYLMHEGCNARAWVHLHTDGDITLDNLKDVYFITGRSESYGVVGRMLTQNDLRNVPPHNYEVFEPLVAQSRRRPFNLYEAHNEISFYTWGDRECCLALGATSATLKDGWRDESSSEEEPPPAKKYEQNAPAEAADEKQAYEQAYQYPKEPVKYEPPKPPKPRERQLRLKVGDVLVFEEVMGPETGVPEDADKSHRHAVRLTRVEPRMDELYDQPVVDIEWALEDALPFTLCLSSIGQPPECRYLEDVSVARGNMILADHGRTTTPESWEVPAATEIPAGCIAPFEPRETILQPSRFRPALKHGPVTHRAPFPTRTAIANAQAQFLGRFMTDVRRRVEQIWRQAQCGQPLSADDLEELEVIFGRKLLVQVGLATTSAKEKYNRTPAEQTEAAGKLLARLEEFLARKARRLRTLRERVLGGYVLTDSEQEELGEMFGEHLASGLALMTGQMLGPASLALRQQPREALPCITVRKRRRTGTGGKPSKQTYPNNHYPRWQPVRDLLSSTGRQRHFVAEIDNEGRAHLRFGNGELGSAPTPATTLQATYRVGNGTSGNVGLEAITLVVFRKTKLSGVKIEARNPMPAQGGTDAEPIAEVKMFAPGAFRKELQRAITSEDYASFAERGRPDKVQRAAANLRWAGSWYEMQTAIDPRGTVDVEAQLLEEIKGSLYRYRRIGHDLTTQLARFVPLAIALEVCVLPHYLRGHVKAALQDVFSNRVLPNGRRGFFHPDNLSFGDSIYLSRLVAAAQSIEGVESVRVTKLQRLGITKLQLKFEDEKKGIDKGVLLLGPFEVARLDNDPNFPEHGTLVLDVRGGR
jgi:predicted phage baseplate assembly protein